MSKKKVIVFDCDEVLLDHLGGVSDWLKKHHNITTPTRHSNQYDLIDWMGVDSYNDVQTYLKAFNSAAYEFGLLKPIHESVHGYLCALRNTYRDAVFAVLTKSGTSGHAEVLRRVNIEHEFPGIFDEVHIIEPYESKRGVLHKLNTKYEVVCLVDDFIGNIETAVNMGIDAIMLQCSHNKEYKDRKDFYYAENWGYVIHNIILKMNKGE